MSNGRAAVPPAIEAPRVATGLKPFEGGPVEAHDHPRCGNLSEAGSQGF